MATFRNKEYLLKLGALSLLFCCKAFVFYAQGSPDVPISTTDITQRFSINAINIEDGMGNSVSDLGDVNGDGIDDIIIGAPEADNGTLLNVGEAYVIFGATGITTADITLDGTTGFAVRGVDSNDRIGTAVSSAGDVNNDGINDILIGGSGKAIVIFGSTTGFSSLYTESSIINGVNGIILEDTSIENNFGETLSILPDVNGDGIDDIIVGDPNGLQGHAYVFYGNSAIGNTDVASLDGSNGFKIEAFSQSHSGLYLNVSNAGDINNDGIEDIVLGYPYYDEGGQDSTGRVAVVYGSSTGFPSVFSLSSLNGTNGFVITEDVGGETLGKAVSDAKDFNGDGIDDIAIIGARTAYVVFGKTTAFGASVDISDIPTTDKFVFTAGWYQTSYMFSDIDGLSDINHDGISDLIVSTSSNYGYAKSGSVYVIYGSTSLPSVMESLEIIGTNGYHIFYDQRYGLNGFGHAVSDAGDFNNDGATDIVVGQRNPRSDEKGATHIFFGNTLDVIDNTAPTINCPSEPQELYANSVLPDYTNFLLDVSDNCSYNTDMVYTQTPAPGTLFTSNTNVEITVTDRSGNTSSCSFMVTLKTTTAEIDCATTTFSAYNLNGDNGLVIYGEGHNSNTGYDVNTAGDVNGDGIDDFIVLAEGASFAFTGPYSAYSVDVEGGVYVVFGTNSGFPPNIDLKYLDGVNGFKISNANFTYKSNYENDFIKADTAGDINNDGYDDIILSNPHRGENNSYEGYVYVVFGKSGGFPAEFDLETLNGSNGFTITGAEESTYLGMDLDNLGDVNGDGIDDVILADRVSSSSVESGKSFVVYGSSSGFPATFDISGLDGSNGFVITSNGTTDGNVGYSVAGIGDVNGDHINDMVIGGEKDRKFVVFGKPSGSTFSSVLYVEDLDGSNGFAVEHSESTLNQYVDSAADVNNDGFNDIIFGGKYILFGNNTFPEVLDLKNLDGTNGFYINNGTGRLLGSVGDFNNDNYDDLVYGDYSPTYIIYGRDSWEASVAVNSGTSGLLAIELLYDYDVEAASYAGDVNNDGIDDFILGQYKPYYGYEVNANPGFAYVFFGQDIADTEGPVMACPENQVLEPENLLPDYTSLVTVTDNCDPNVVIAQDPVEGSTYTPGMTVKLTATDKSGNETSCTFIVNSGADTEPPTASNPPIVNVQCADDVPLPDPEVITDEADNSGVPPTVTHIGDVSDGSTAPETITRTYRVSDESGNYIDVTQTILVEDTLAPTANTLATVSVQCSGDVPAPDVSVVTGVTDNCTLSPTVTYIRDISDGNGIAGDDNKNLQGKRRIR